MKSSSMFDITWIASNEKLITNPKITKVIIKMTIIFKIKIDRD